MASAPTTPASQATAFPHQNPALSKMRIEDDYVGEFALESAEVAKEEMAKAEEATEAHLQAGSKAM